MTDAKFKLEEVDPYDGSAAWLRRNLARYLGQQENEIGIETCGPGDVVIDILSASDAVLWSAKDWCDAHTPLGAQFRIARLQTFRAPAVPTSCPRLLCGTRLHRIDDRLHNSVRLRCPNPRCDFTWHGALGPAQAPPKHKPKAVTGPNLHTPDNPLGLTTKEREEVRAGAVRAMTNAVRKRMAEACEQHIGRLTCNKLLQGTDLPCSSMTLRCTKCSLEFSVSGNVAKECISCGCESVQFVSFGFGAVADERVHTLPPTWDALRDHAGIEVDVLRAGQRWRNPEDTETLVVGAGAVSGRPVLFRTTGARGDYDASELISDGWRCIYDVPSETRPSSKAGGALHFVENGKPKYRAADGTVYDFPQASAVALEPCPHCTGQKYKTLITSMPDEADNGMWWMCNRCKRRFDRVESEPAKPQQVDPWGTYPASHDVNGMRVVGTGADYIGAIGTLSANGERWQVHCDDGRTISAMVAFLDPREAWRPLKPARVERGQCWRWSGAGPVVVRKVVDHLDGSRLVNMLGEHVGHAERALLACDDWEWVVEP
jgi:predicted  nucleic acid-binding Zn-ribbon protein